MPQIDESPREEVKRVALATLAHNVDQSQREIEAQREELKRQAAELRFKELELEGRDNALRQFAEQIQKQKPEANAETYAELGQTRARVKALETALSDAQATLALAKSERESVAAQQGEIAFQYQAMLDLQSTLASERQASEQLRGIIQKAQETLEQRTAQLQNDRVELDRLRTEAADDQQRLRNESANLELERAQLAEMKKQAAAVAIRAEKTRAMEQRLREAEEALSAARAEAKQHTQALEAVLQRTDAKERDLLATVERLQLEGRAQAQKLIDYEQEKKTGQNAQELVDARLDQARVENEGLLARVQTLEQELQKTNTAAQVARDEALALRDRELSAAQAKAIDATRLLAEANEDRSRLGEQVANFEAEKAMLLAESAEKLQALNQNQATTMAALERSLHEARTASQEEMRRLRTQLQQALSDSEAQWIERIASAEKHARTLGEQERAAMEEAHAVAREKLLQELRDVRAESQRAIASAEDKAHNDVLQARLELARAREEVQAAVSSAREHTQGEVLESQKELVRVQKELVALQTELIEVRHRETEVKRREITLQVQVAEKQEIQAALNQAQIEKKTLEQRLWTMERTAESALQITSVLDATKKSLRDLTDALQARENDVSTLTMTLGKTKREKDDLEARLQQSERALREGRQQGAEMDLVRAELNRLREEADRQGAQKPSRGLLLATVGACVVALLAIVWGATRNTAAPVASAAPLSAPVPDAAAAPVEKIIEAKPAVPVVVEAAPVVDAAPAATPAKPKKKKSHDGLFDAQFGN